MKKMDYLVLLLVLLFLVARFSNLSHEMVTHFLSGSYANEFLDMKLRVWDIILTILKAIVNIGIAIWIFKESKKGEETSWVWLIFSLTYGIFAPILFYLMRCYAKLELLSNQSND